MGNTTLKGNFVHHIQKILIITFAIPFFCFGTEVVQNAIQDDKKLNYAYQESINLLDKEQKIKLKNAQLLWIKYRDSLCEFEDTLLISEHWIEEKNSNSKALECISRLSIVRTKELNEYTRLVLCTKNNNCVGETIIIGGINEYRPFGVPGGYKNTRINNNSFMVEYYGNHNVQGKKLKRFWEKRASELCPKGYDTLKGKTFTTESGLIVGTRIRHASVYPIFKSAIQCK